MCICAYMYPFVCVVHSHRFLIVALGSWSSIKEEILSKSRPDRKICIHASAHDLASRDGVLLGTHEHQGTLGRFDVHASARQGINARFDLRTARHCRAETLPRLSSSGR